MKIFIDTANISEIRRAAAMGIVAGVTTNPSLVAREGRDFKETLKEILEIVDGPISAEVVSTDAKGMISEGIELSSIHKNIVIKVPMTEDGLQATKVLSEKGIGVNVTLIFTPSQALLAARAGAAYVSPFVGRLDDIGERGMYIVKRIADIFKLHSIGAEIISASVRSPQAALESAEAGAHIGTLPFKVIEKMLHHHLTDAGIERFLADWKKFEER